MSGSISTEAEFWAHWVATKISNLTEIDKQCCTETQNNIRPFTIPDICEAAYSLTDQVEELFAEGLDYVAWSKYYNFEGDSRWAVEEFKVEAKDGGELKVYSSREQLFNHFVRLCCYFVKGQNVPSQIATLMLPHGKPRSNA